MLFPRVEHDNQVCLLQCLTSTHTMDTTDICFSGCSIEVCYDSARTLAGSASDMHEKLRVAHDACHQIDSHD